MAASWRPRPAIVIAGLGLSVVGMVCGVGWRWSKGGRLRCGAAILVPSILLAGMFSGLVMGTARAVALEDSGLRSHLGERMGLEVVVTSPVRSSGGWQSATVTITRCDAEKSATGEKAWLEVPPDEDGVRLAQGQIVGCRVKIRDPEGASDSGFNQRLWLLQQGVSIVLQVTDANTMSVVGQRGGIAGAFDRLREAAREHLYLGPDDQVDQVLEGVVTGDTVGIEPEWLESFRRSGTAHMLSVSGLHVASLAAIMMGLARLLRAPRWVGFVMAALAAVFMIPFVGPSPPIIRAAIMIVIVLFGRWVGRGRDQWQILALAAAAILAINPFALFDVGFQLSFSAFVGMMTLGPLLRKILKRLPEGIAANIAVSVAAGAGTAPVALAQFGRTSLVSPLANLLVVPTLPIITGLGMTSVFLGFAWRGLSVALDTLASLPMMWTVLVCRLTARAPVLDSGDVGHALAAVAGMAIALPIALVLIGRSVRAPLGLPLPFFRRSLRWVRRHRPRHRLRAMLSASAVLAVGLVLGIGMWSAGEKGLSVAQAVWGGRGWPDCVELRVLDVGQGNAVLVRTPEHHTLLFDGGPAGCDLAGQLRSLGVRRLDVVVISHPHADHFAGLLEALPEVEVGTLIDHVQIAAVDPRGSPSGSDEGSTYGGDEAHQYLELRRLLAERGCSYVLAHTGGSITVDGVVASCFTPKKPLTLTEGEEPWTAMGGPPTGDELNAASIVVSIECGALGAVIPGDAEADALARYDLPPAEILLVSHHGSRGAVTTSMLERLGIRVGIVSVGSDNTFGHPDPSTITVLEETIDSVFRTDTVGWVCCSLRGAQISITTERTPTR